MVYKPSYNKGFTCQDSGGDRSIDTSIEPSQISGLILFANFELQVFGG